MDDGGHRENGRHKADQYKTAQSQWLMHHQPSMKQIMAIMAERDAAIQERNMALSDKKHALTERDMAFMQRDSAIGERNNALLERDNALATLQYRDNSMNPTTGNHNNNNMQQCPPGCQISRGVRHMHHPPHQFHEESSYNPRDMQLINDSIPLSPVLSEPAKSRKGKRAKEPTSTSTKKASKPSKKPKKEGEDSKKGTSSGFKTDWKDQDLGLNQVAYDESTMPAPVCSCTGTLRQCYKWGSGGWQSSCCTTTVSMYPLPSVPNKRHGRVGGRKMSGSAYNKLLSRLAAAGHDLSNPVDLKDNWAKHGTNRYITIK